MGTNYFLVMNEGCIYHIGKKSNGIKFIFNCSKIQLDEWFKILKDANYIFDEYNNKIGYDEMIGIIESNGEVPKNAYYHEYGYFYIDKDFF